MKFKITIILTLALSLSGCAFLNGSNDSSKKLPKCNGKYTRALNKDKWDWANTNSNLQEIIIKPAVTPVIISMLIGEEQQGNGTFNVASLNSIDHEMLSYNNCGSRT
ncbi:type IV secretion system protein VirB7 [Bartonella sp. CB175]|uniref:type IV secretion system protein VirB7 n=1 Tax=Bartonella sp. CB175 TaxID=3112256 RepID=UPI00300E176B